jgi:hypothetical protein
MSKKFPEGFLSDQTGAGKCRDDFDLSGHALVSRAFAAN